MIATSLAIAAAGLAVAAVGAGTSVYGAVKSNEANKEKIAAEQQSEDLRKQQMELDASRRRREVVRQSVMARAQAESTTTEQGASIGSSLPGAFGSISGRTGVNTLGINQNEQIGQGMFAANMEGLNASRDAANASTISSIGGGMTTLGNAALTNAGQIYKVGDWVASKFS